MVWLGFEKSKPQLREKKLMVVWGIIELCLFRQTRLIFGKDDRGTSIVKYTTPLPCIGSGKSDSRLYFNFEFCEGKIINFLKTHWSTILSNSSCQKHFQVNSTYF